MASQTKTTANYGSIENETETGTANEKIEYFFGQEGEYE